MLSVFRYQSVSNIGIFLASINKLTDSQNLSQLKTLDSTIDKFL